MNDDRRKRLTGYLGDCWQTIENSWGQDYPCNNRTFTTWPDLGALVERIAEKGDALDFFKFAIPLHHKEKRKSIKTNAELLIDLILWFLNPTRFCELVDKWLEGKEKAK